MEESMESLLSELITLETESTIELASLTIQLRESAKRYHYWRRIFRESEHTIVYWRRCGARPE